MSSSKAVKAILFSAQAQEHDVLTKIKNVQKWLKSGYNIKVQINGKADRHKAIEALYKQIETSTKLGAEFTQKVVKPESIKFIMKPTPGADALKIDDSTDKASDEKELESIMSGVDVFSDEFEKQLAESIRQERQKNKKRSKP